MKLKLAAITSSGQKFFARPLLITAASFRFIANLINKERSFFFLEIILSPLLGFQEEGTSPKRELLTRDGRFACTNPNCDKTFKNRTDCNYHIKNRCNKPPRYKCCYCDYKSHLSGNIKVHLKTHHKGLQLNIIDLYDPSTETPIFTCPNNNCKSIYLSRSNLLKHINYECGKSPNFGCFYCGYKYFFKSDLENHTASIHPDKQIRYVNL